MKRSAFARGLPAFGGGRGDQGYGRTSKNKFNLYKSKEFVMRKTIYIMISAIVLSHFILATSSLADKSDVGFGDLFNVLIEEIIPETEPVIKKYIQDASQITVDIIKGIQTAPGAVINNIRPEYDIYENVNGKSLRGVRFTLSLRANDIQGARELDVYAVMRERDSQSNVPTILNNYILKNGKTGLKEEVSITPNNMNNIIVKFFFPYDAFHVPNGKHYVTCDFEVYYEKKFLTAAKQNWWYNGGYGNITAEAKVKIVNVKTDYNLWEKLGTYKYKGMVINIGLKAIDINKSLKVKLCATVTDKETGNPISTFDNKFLLNNGKTGVEKTVTVTSDNSEKAIKLFFPYAALGYNDRVRHELNCDITAYIGEKKLSQKNFGFNYIRSTKPEVIKVEDTYSATDPTIDKAWCVPNVTRGYKSSEKGIKILFDIDSHAVKENKDLTVKITLTKKNGNKIKANDRKYLLSDGNMGIETKMVLFRGIILPVTGNVFIPYRAFSLAKTENYLNCSVQLLYNGKVLSTKKFTISVNPGSKDETTMGKVEISDLRISHNVRSSGKQGSQKKNAHSINS